MIPSSTQTRLGALLNEFPTPARPTEAVAHDLLTLSLPADEVVSQRQLNLAVCTLHVEVMWDLVARWVKANNYGLPTGARTTGFLCDVRSLEDSSTWYAAQSESGVIYSALAGESTYILETGLREACWAWRREQLLGETSKSLFDFTDIEDLYAFTHRGMTTAQNEFWHVAPVLPELFRSTFGVYPNEQEFRGLMGALRAHNYRFSHTPVEFLFAIGGAISEVCGYIEADGRAAKDLTKAYRLLSPTTLDFSVAVFDILS